MKAPINTQWAEALGLTLFDSLWQGAIVLIISFVLLLALRKASPAKRYAVVLVAILAIPILSVGTFFTHYDNSTQKVAQSQMIWDASVRSFEFQLGETLAATNESLIPLSPLAQWKVWTAKNATWALVVWLTGVFMFTIRMLGGFYFLNRLKNKAEPIVEPLWLDKLSRLCERLKIKGSVLLKESERISSPLVMGIIKPVIIFPLGLIQALATNEVEAILVHELAHIKRKDFLINIVVNVLQVVYFFHPAFWWLKAQLDAEREFHCDDITLGHLGEKLTLIRALTNASEYQGQKFQPALAFAGKRNQLLNRVKRIIYHKPQMNWLSGFLSLGILVLSFVLMSQNALQEAIPEMADLIEDNIENLEQENVVQDTTTVAKAILELLKPDSKITVKTNAAGVVTMVMNDKTEITGEDFKAYMKAYEQINNFSKQTLAEKAQKSAALIQMAELDNQKIEEALKAKDMADAKKARDYNRRVDEVLAEVTKAKMLKEESKRTAEQVSKIKMQVDQNRIRLEARKVEREIPEVQVAIQKLKKEMKASGMNDSTALKQYEKKLEELSSHWQSLSIYLSNLNKYEKEVNQYLADMNNSIDFVAPQLVYEYRGKLYSEEEKINGNFAGLTVADVENNYPYFDKKANKEIKVKLVRLEDRKAGEESDLGIRLANAQDKSTVRYMVDGKLKDGAIMNTLDPNQIEDIWVIKGQAAVLKQYPDIPTPVSGLIIFTTKKDYDPKSSTMRVRVAGAQNKSATLYIMDGKVIDSSELNKIDPNQIADVQVIKGQAVKVLYPEIGDAVSGVVAFSTKNGFSPFQEQDSMKLTLKNVSKKISDDKNDPVELKFFRGESTDQNLVYEVDNQIVDDKTFFAKYQKLSTAIEVVNDQEKILTMHPNLTGEKLLLIRVSTKKNNDLSPNSLLIKDPLTESDITHDFTRIELGDNLSYDLQLKFISDRLNKHNFIIDMDGELKPEMTFADLNQLRDKKVQTLEIIKNDKMYEYHNKRKLKGYDALIRIITK
jgi:beta-lactamase regulating signal transducer with metallopeptidase domain